MTHRTAAACLCAVLLGGCSSVNVVKNPGPSDNGIRYYRPKPYLLVTPADPTGRMVKVEVLQLPDYCEEYSIHPKGKKPPAVQLKDGWNLVGVGGPPAPPAAPEPAPTPPPVDPLKLPEAVLVAGNVPIGLYESVFDMAGPVKYLKGWRYVGFSPFGSGGPPNGTDAQGVQNLRNGCPPCVAPGSVMQGPLFGLVFFNGAMTFRQLDEIGNNMTCPEYIKPPIRGAAPSEITPVRPETPEGPQIRPVRPETPRTPEIQSTPPTEGTGTPRSPSLPPSNPGSASRNAPRPHSLPLDAQVRQTSGATQRPAVKHDAVPRTAPTPKAVDAKRLEALEAEVFKSLDYSPTAGMKGSGTVPSGDPVGAAPAGFTSESMAPPPSPATPSR
jgi:hypothetical protein